MTCGHTKLTGTYCKLQDKHPGDCEFAVLISEPIPLILFCPLCHMRHVDKGEFATKLHHTHSCQSCGFTWRPTVANTVGVQFLPGFKDTP